MAEIYITSDHLPDGEKAEEGGRTQTAPSRDGRAEGQERKREGRSGRRRNKKAKGEQPAVTLQINGGDPLRLIGDFLLLIFYGAFFALLTRAFMMLGMLEYFGKPKPAAAAETKA